MAFALGFWQVIYVTPAHLIGASYGGTAWATKTKPVI